VMNLLKSIPSSKPTAPKKNKALEKLETSIKALQAIYLGNDLKSTKTLEVKLNHIMDKLAAMERTVKKQPTYSEIAQLGLERQQETRKVQEIREKNMQARENRRLEAAKSEVILTLEHADDSVKMAASAASHEQIAQQLQSTIDEVANQETRPPTIQGIQKLKSGDIKIKCSTPSEVKQLRNINWNQLTREWKYANQNMAL